MTGLSGVTTDDAAQYGTAAIQNLALDRGRARVTGEFVRGAFLAVAETFINASAHRSNRQSQKCSTAPQNLAEQRSCLVPQPLTVVLAAITVCMLVDLPTIRRPIE
ncbi:hypothetical protein FXF51_41110 [Nonomuraea sp. PA05]|uniref:hypothetical protein n=1 Tax=Nonomuraea sp. PA05 TaxID=2604466 RepID=UPI0011D35EBE|nr:hypothetical protein [Nonomuraea sp. PA05]TYB57225.1 hypothetical protein FXF51_41110 [Nonomuraea sp. PA05]